MIIAIEGLDGAGKHTQTVIVQKALIDKGIDVTTGSFPRYGDTLHSEFISDYLAGQYGNPSDVAPELAGMLFARERIESIDWINCKTSASQVFIVDRYTPSNLAYQLAKVPEGEQLNLGKELLTYEQYHKVPNPDLIVYLKWPVESCVERIKQRATIGSRGEDEIEKDIAYLRSTGKVYDNLDIWDDLYGPNVYKVVDCSLYETIPDIGFALTDVVIEAYRVYTLKQQN